MKLVELAKGAVASVTAFCGDPATEALLREIGFSENQEVEMLGAGPLGGSPLSIRLNRMVVALRREEAACIKVRPVT